MSIIKKEALSFVPLNSIYVDVTTIFLQNFNSPDLLFLISHQIPHQIQQLFTCATFWSLGDVAFLSSSNISRLTKPLAAANE